jgi:hypothetical protein
MSKAILVLIALFSRAYASPLGFENGNEFTANPITGQVQVTCDGFNGNSSARYTCRDIALDPRAYDFFVGPRDARANQVVLENVDENGSIKSKVLTYEGSFGKSKEAVNLWISTIFQKPILKLGTNKIRYSIYSSHQPSQPYSSGIFEAIVRRGVTRICPDGRYISHDTNDCNSQYSICQKYFAEFKNCRIQKNEQSVEAFHSVEL